ncbi:type I restriction enzyme endonuclease domain-containing protein [Fodinibius sp.]|uniref:type I restriction enzyme endonuclease domain-containing protein n=1 Tax=Fodinibius sp. TaxID=1872440 RepID=UPI00356685D9
MDYVGVVRNLQKAPAVYATGHKEVGPEATNPVKDKSELFDFVQDLNEEQERHDRENLSEEQLAVFDIVTQLEKIELTKKERDQIKKGITELTEKFKQEKLVMY